MPVCIYMGIECDEYRIGMEECDDCVDGRFIGCVCEYASSCDDCGQLTSHDAMRRNAEDLGFCEECVAKMSQEELATLIEEEEM